MTDFTVNVQRDDKDRGINTIELLLDSDPKREILVHTTRHGDEDDDTNIEDTALYYAVERIAQLESENRKLRMQYAGTIGVLAELSGHYNLSNVNDREEAVETLHTVADDWCSLSGWNYEVVGHKLSVYPPELTNG